MKNTMTQFTLRLLLLIALCFGAGMRSYSQPGGSVSIIQAPCRADGIIACNVYGLTPPITYHYSCNITHTNSSQLSDTLYNCTAFKWIIVTDALNQEIFLNTGLINTILFPEFTYTQPLCPDTAASVFVSYPGINPVDAYWFEYDPVTQLTGDSMASGNPAILGLGTYYVIPVDTNGCFIMQDSNYFTMEQRNPFTLSITSLPAHCTNGSIFLISNSVANPPLQYHWSNGLSDSILSNLSTGMYDVTISDNIGCSESHSVFVDQTVHLNLNFIVQPASCLNADGSVYAFVTGGQPPYTYNWSNGNHTAALSQISGNVSLSLTVIDSNGCVGNGYTYIGNSTPIYVTYTSNPCHCQMTDGRAILSVNAANLPYSVQWQTNPVQTGDTLENAAPGVYAFIITDSQGCSQQGSVIISAVNTINPNPQVSPPVCPATTGTITLNPTGSAPPFTYVWSTGNTFATAQVTANTLYSCTITDADGCSVTKDFSVARQNPLNISIAATPASCIYAHDGSLLATVSGGTPPYSFSWSQGQSTPSVTGLMQGNYYLVVHDADGCTENGFRYLGYNSADSSCYCSITGTAYYDQDGDCERDPGEYGIPDLAIYLSGVGYAFTDHDGLYEFRVQDGNYTISEMQDDFYPVAACQPNGIPLSIATGSACNTTIDFSNGKNLIHDLSIHRFEESPPVPGFTYNQRLLVKNRGTFDEDTISAGLESDIQSTMLSSAPNPYVQPDPINDPNFFSTQTGNIVINQHQSLIVYQYYQMDPGIPVNTLVNFIDTLASGTQTEQWLQDFTPYDNICYFTSRVVSSWDPNYKEVSPAGKGEDGEIGPADSVLTYTIHFQNTGTWYAQQVVLIDTLDPALDPQTFKPVYSSHSYKIEISENGVAKISFPSIMLAWDEPGSRGLFAYSIKLRNGISNGSKIFNAANIYFDYNKPVRTNTVLNTLNRDMGITEIAVEEGFRIFPNPADDEINVESFNEPIQKIEIFDIDGRKVREMSGCKALSYKLNINDLKDGIYILTIKDIKGNSVCKKLAII